MTPRRLPTPDIARGAMLLLIALANATSWAPRTPTNTTPTIGPNELWVLIRGLFIDARAYPLFSILVGFGIATIASRATTTPTILYRRAAALTLIGLLHSFLFSGDVLATYGLTIALLTPLITTKHPNTTALTITAFGFTALALAITTFIGFNPTDQTPESNGPYLFEWLGKTISSIPTTAVIPCIIIGIFIQRTTLLSHPHRHRRLLATTAATGLLIGALTAIPLTLTYIGITISPLIPWTIALDTLGSYFGGLGWLALITLTLSYTNPTHHPTTSGYSPRAILTAIGKRSMTCYLLQSALFALLLPANSGPVTEIHAAAIAVIIWLITALTATIFDRAGIPGPAEWVTRRLIYAGVSRD
ncbi:DUF418 domain-containing protein [Dermatophilus congolensis]|uniref:DUF418 domain-containing protein n=7 Tax=Dermatophilus congolensis TaxID=1863 RepID=UPI001AAEFA05|nr:DUF418 domain-containing protein [Dermatophilus congolensis]MBO3177609.1 DUF418 domain-containing protein [Dermatophilus congolensis]MBO3200777.1 DUF418 domain-containing protein [Dermatophilus congolensis]MBO3216606.1 DUF418 domain-containing protein [Dermatophilus congolensis]